MRNTNPYLLPRTVTPIHYDIELTPDLAKFTFAGSGKIRINIREATQSITLHALELKIKSAELRLPQGQALKPKRIAPSRKFESITLHFAETLPPGEAELLMTFRGELNDKMHGFYRTSYLVNGNKTWGAATQFEATDARRAFPCWDEPELKATFSAALNIPGHMTALSNMPVREEGPASKGMKKVSFEKTPIMPTYLVAFVIADLEYLEDKDRNGIPIRVYTSPGKKEQGQFAMKAACHTLPYFAEWFGIPYAFPKLDMVALPDFAAGAMENWGLVTYRETALLIDPRNSSAAAHQRVAEVVDHELAHQWFGNYTTMKWWTDLWLNEGFASYMGPKASDHHFPEWDTWTQYVAQRYMSALHEDSMKSTHPVEVPVKNPYEIREVFDAISYSKGSVINRMLEHYLGEENLRKGLNIYLSRHAFGNATTEDLWQALEEASGKPVKAMMASYTRQPGYPVLTVNSVNKRGGVQLKIEQQRFLLDGGKEAKKLRWQIPVGVLTLGASEPAIEYMEKSRHAITVAGAKNGGDGWIKLNPGQSGFYRVAYPNEMWLRLAKAVEDGAMPTVDRLGILDDAFALARAGYLDPFTALSVLTAYKHEQDYSVWLLIADAFSTLRNLLSEGADAEPLRHAAREFFRPIAERKKWDAEPGDGHLDVLLRALALRNLGGYGDHATIDEAKKRFERFRHEGTLDPNLRQTVYALTAENGGEKEWQELLGIYNGTQLHEERVRVLSGAGQCRREPVVHALLEFCISEHVRFQDTPIVIASMASHAIGRKLAWEFVKHNWEMFVERYAGGGLGLLTRVICIGSGFSTPQELADLEAFFGSHPVQGTERTVSKTLEMVRSNIAWMERDRGRIASFFAAAQGAPVSGD